MRLVIETSNFLPFLQRNKREIKFLSLYAVIIAFLILGAYIWGVGKYLIRDFVVANVAYVEAGDKIPFLDNDEEGYTRGFKIDTNSVYTYGMESNNVWMAEYTRLIVPYMLYEHVTPQPIYPFSAGSIPFPGNQSFHVAGRMIPSRNTIFLNERYWLDSRWSDQRRALATLVHELVHIQRGAYISGTSAQLESATSTATVEVLAAMCNYGDELACRAFWYDVSSLARSSLLVNLDELGLVGVYEFWANLFWRDAGETDSYNKAMRHWDETPGGLMTIRKKYQLVPWEAVIAGVTVGTPLDTGHVNCSRETSKCYILGMKFDDAWYLLQGLVWIME
jgi:hypothetical protein